MFSMFLSSNLLSIYQITHLRDGHRVEFLPDSVQMHSLKDNSLVVVGKVNNHKRLYSFSHFNSLVTHITSGGN